MGLWLSVRNSVILENRESWYLSENFHTAKCGCIFINKMHFIPDVAEILLRSKLTTATSKTGFKKN